MEFRAGPSSSSSGGGVVAADLVFLSWFVLLEVVSSGSAGLLVFQILMDFLR